MIRRYYRVNGGAPTAISPSRRLEWDGHEVAQIDIAVNGDERKRDLVEAFSLMGSRDQLRAIGDELHMPHSPSGQTYLEAMAHYIISGDLLMAGDVMRDCIAQAMEYELEAEL